MTTPTAIDLIAAERKRQSDSGGTMTDEFQAAAEEIGELCGAHWHGSVEPIAAILRRRFGGREDDGETLTEEWLRSVGFQTNRYGVLDFHPFVAEVWDGEVVVNCKRWPKPIKTRGDLRLLARALGITLTEPAEEPRT